MKLRIILLISLLPGTLVHSQDVKNTIGQNEVSIDSIAYSRDDAFLGYSVYDIFLNSKGEVLLHKVERYAREFANGRKTHLGSLKKGQLDKVMTERIFNNANNLIGANLKDKYKTDRSDQTSVSISFFHQGQKIKSVVDYGMKGSDKLVAQYSLLDSLENLTYHTTWNSERLNISFLENTAIDSIQFIQHLKSNGSYYKNGVSQCATLKGNDLKDFIFKSKNFVKENPYKNPNYEIMPSEVERYSMYVYYSGGSKEWIKYNGKRFKKKTYLDFGTPKNVVKKYLNQGCVDYK